MISNTGKYPFYAEISSTAMKRFKYKKTTIISKLFSCNSKHLVLNEVMGNNQGALIWNNTWINHPWEAWNFRMTKGVVFKEFDEAIYLVNHFMHMHAHCILDLLAPFNLLPEDVKRKYPLIIGIPSQFVIEAYCALGYNRSNLFLIPSGNDFVLVHKMHYVFGIDQVNSHFGLSLQKLRASLKRVLGFDLIPPTRYILVNRKPKEKRYFYNFKELCSAIIEKFNKYNWEIIEAVPSDLNSTVMFWNSVKLVHAVAGSVFANALFMQNGTAACLHLANWHDIPAISTCLSYGIILFISDTRQCKHFQYCHCLASINSSIASIGRALIYLSKSNETLESCFNITNFNYTIFKQ